MVRWLASLLFLWVAWIPGQAQTMDSLSEQPAIGFWDIPEEPIKKRVIGLSAGLAGAYGITMTGLNYLWYADAERGRFRFFNDAREWNQIDKVGHLHTAYFESYWAYKLYRWTGVDDKKAAWIGAGLGFAFQTSIEVFDGFSTKWGASWSDVLFNGMGSALFLSQQLTWGEQRIRSKYSFHAVEHSDSELQQRAENLYGTGFAERLIKDYNGLVTWLSFSPASFMKGNRKLKWLTLAVGYGAGGMYGGFENAWETDDGTRIERFDVERYRSFYLSMDIDLEALPVKKRGAKTLLAMLNIIKVPAPAFEFNTKGEIIFHPMFYLNWNYPLFLKR